MSPHACFSILASLGLLVGTAPAEAAFSCAAQSSAPADKIDLGSMPLSTTSPGLPQPVLATIGRMQTNGVPSGRIVDALVEADCQHVATDTGLSDRAKGLQIQRFASRVATYVYSNPTSTEEDILIDVPVPHRTFDAVAAAAKKENMSQDAWVNAAIQSKLKPE